MTIFTNPSTIDSSKYRRPYLTFKEEVTQLILNPYSLVLFLFIIKLLFFLNSLLNSLDQAQTQTHLLYNSVNAYASAIVSFPHYIAKISNIMIAKSVEAANNGLVESLQLVILASENLIYFVIELSIGTYACLLTAAIDDTAIAALNATESLISIANETLISFATDLNNGLEDLSDVINEVIDTLDDTGDALKHMFEDNSSSSSSKNSTIEEHISHVNLTIASMRNWQISSSVNDKIEELSNKIPTFTDVQNYTENIIDAPFSELKRQVSSNLNNTFNADTMYVPGLTTLNFTNGKNEIDKLYLDAIYVAKTATHIIMGLVGFAILLLLLYEFYVEFKEWKRVIEASNHLNFANESFINNSLKKKYNIEVIKSMQNRKADFISYILIKKIFRIEDPTVTNNMRWIINYAASPFLLSFLLLGLLGILSVICQYIILLLISKIDFTALSKNILESSIVEVHSAFNSSLNQWTNETNIYINNYENDINDNLFAWIDTAATTINNTVTEFDDRMNEALDSLFKGTPLYTPIEQIVGCVIESKLKKIEEAMTWLTENAVLKMPQLDPETILRDMIKIQANDTNDSLEIDIETFKNDAKNIFTGAISFYKDECTKLLYISVGILAVWFVFFLAGLMMLYFKERNYQKRNAKECSFDKEKISEISADIPFDGSTKYSSFFNENVEDIERPFTKIIQNFRDRYLKAKENYTRTPTEPEIKTCDYMEIYNNTRINQENRNKDEFSMNFEKPDNDVEDTLRNSGTLSDIGENIKSITQAKRWDP